MRKYEYANTDWFKTLFRPSLTQNHTVSLSGGGENATVYASVGFFVDPGWTIADRVHRVTGNLKTTYNLSPKVKIGVLTQGSIRTQRAPGTYNRTANTVSGGYDRDFDINPLVMHSIPHVLCVLMVMMANTSTTVITMLL